MPRHLGTGQNRLFKVKAPFVGWRGKLFARRGTAKMADGRILGQFVRIALLLLTFNFQLSTVVHAQGIAYTAPQGYTAFPFTNTTCTGSAQNSATLTNNNQTEHFLTLTTSGGVLAIRATVQGSHDGVTWNDISDVATQNASTVMGQGYYPLNRVSVTCATAAGTFTVQYSGEATAPAPQIGAMQSAQIDKTLAVGIAANASFQTQTIRAPFGNSGGGIYFSYAAGGPSGSTLNVGCTTLALPSPGTPLIVASFPLTTVVGLQFFPVPLLPCDFITVFYNSGGASATTFTASYVFNPLTITGGDPCQGATAPKSSVAISQAAAGTQQLVAGTINHKIYVCGYNFTITGSTTATALLEFGTNASCAAGTTALSGAWAGNAITASSDPVHILAGGGYSVATVPTGDFLCLVAGGTTPSVQGILTFIQQ
jgi:hypothetical protein